MVTGNVIMTMFMVMACDKIRHCVDKTVISILSSLSVQQRTQHFGQAVCQHNLRKHHMDMNKIPTE